MGRGGGLKNTPGIPRMPVVKVDLGQSAEIEATHPLNPVGKVHKARKWPLNMSNFAQRF